MQVGLHGAMSFLDGAGMVILSGRIVGGVSERIKHFPVIVCFASIPYNWTIPMASGCRLHVMFQYSEVWAKASYEALWRKCPTVIILLFLLFSIRVSFP